MPVGAARAILRGLDAVRVWQEDFYRDLHAHPELPHQERRTAGLVAARLRDAGCEVHEGVGDTGVVGIVRNGAGPSVLLRADMDALPVREETGLSYASTRTIDDGTPVMHACGHDVHVTCLLGSVTLLAQSSEQWSGTLVAVFQPAEETADGARAMVESGLVDLVGQVDVAMAQHVLPFAAGRVGTRPGPTLSAADSMRITLHGRGAHGSMPQAAVDPVVLAASVVVRLQTVVAREVAPGDTAVLTVGSIQAGTKSNVIPDHAVLLLNVRTYDEHTRSTVLAAIERIVRGECEASGSPKEPEFALFDRYPLTDNDTDVTGRVRRRLRRNLRGSRGRTASAERERGLQRHPPRARHAVHLLGHRRDRRRHLPCRGEGGTGGPGHPGQPLRVVRPGHPAHPRHRHTGARGGCDGVARPIVNRLNHATPPLSTRDDRCASICRTRRNLAGASIRCRSALPAAEIVQPMHVRTPLRNPDFMVSNLTAQRGECLAY
ncbi:MAG TPA: amidohydrolase [Nocardioides sp.]|nr:amidohydrolase [Nocardioides sp.]